MYSCTQYVSYCIGDSIIEGTLDDYIGRLAITLGPIHSLTGLDWSPQFPGWLGEWQEMSDSGL